MKFLMCVFILIVYGTIMIIARPIVFPLTMILGIIGVASGKIKQ